MRTLGIAALVVLGTLGGSRPGAAQEVRGFAGAGTASEYSSTYPSFGGGVLVDAGQRWVSVGAQGDGFVSWPYFAGRATLFAQGNLVPKGTFRPFILAGQGFGELDGVMFGGGLEVRPAGSRIGFRAAVENYRKTYRGIYGSSTANHMTMRVGVLFR
jgi:hypothetical protein